MLFDFVIGSQFGYFKLPKIKKLYAKSAYVYPTNMGNYSYWWWATVRILSDVVPGLGPCAVRWLARKLEQGGTSNLYTYLFAHPEQKKNSIPGSGPGSVIVPHAI